MKDMECVLKQCRGLIVVSSKFTKGLCLLLKSPRNGLNRLAAFELGGKWMFEEIYARLFFILLQPRLKK
jgi:hypothetical protein